MHQIILLIASVKWQLNQTAANLKECFLKKGEKSLSSPSD